MSHLEQLVAPGGSAQRAAPAEAPLADGFSVRPWPDALGPVLDAHWDRLAASCAVPNPFYERWYLTPSFRHFDPGGEVRLATLVVGGNLVALMPLARKSRYYGLPLPHLTNWQHPNIFCGEPLVVAEHADAFAQELLGWCDSNPQQALFLSLSGLPRDGLAFDAISTAAGRNGRSARMVQAIERAALHRGPTPQEHLRQALERKRRKELQRKRRRLEEAGTLVFSRQSDATDLTPWIDEFLTLEASSWKGEQGSALASAPATEALFRESLEGAARAGKLERLAFHLDGRPVAMLSSFLSGSQGFGFKTAYAADLAKLSPGMLLQVENLAILEHDDIVMSDSCAAPDHPMIGQIWPHRRKIALLSVAIGGALRRAVGAGLIALEIYRTQRRQ